EECSYPADRVDARACLPARVGSRTARPFRDQVMLRIPLENRILDSKGNQLPHRSRLELWTACFRSLRNSRLVESSLVRCPPHVAVQFSRGRSIDSLPENKQDD